MSIVPPTTDKITVEWVDITPELAFEWLTDNDDNRKIREGRVRRLAQQFKNGEIVQTPDLIAFDTEGKLLNGQHRLHGVIEADVTVRFLVGRGFERETFLYTDQGAKRSMADHFDQLKVPNAHNAASTTRNLIAYATATTGARQPLILSGKREPSAAKVYEMYLANAGIINLGVSAAGRCYNHLGHGQLAWAVFFAHAYAVDTADAEAFLSGVCSAKIHGPTLMLRDLMLRDARKNKPQQFDRHQTLALIIKTWNAWRKGEEIQNLRWSGGGSKPQPFPTIAGLDKTMVDLSPIT